MSRAGRRAIGILAMLIAIVAAPAVAQQRSPDGAAAPDPANLNLLSPLVAPVLTLNGQSIPIYFSGLSPGYVGLYQMNFQVPPGTPNGDLQLVLTQTVRVPRAVHAFMVRPGRFHQPGHIGSQLRHQLRACFAMRLHATTLLI